MLLPNEVCTYNQKRNLNNILYIHRLIDNSHFTVIISSVDNSHFTVIISSVKSRRIVNIVKAVQFMWTIIATTIIQIIHDVSIHYEDQLRQRDHLFYFHAAFRNETLVH